jgi:hypothetical protein
MKQCSKCKETRPLELFFKQKKTKDGLQNYCKICSRKIQAENDATPHGRANKLIHTMRNNKGGKRAKMEKTLTIEDITPILEAGHCQLTGLPFDFMPSDKTHKNSHAPSLDRIDSQKGYTKENCRIVLSAVNDALGENDDKDILPILKALVKGLEKNAKKNKLTPVPTRPHIQGAVGAELGSVSAPWTWENSDDTDGHSRAIQGQDIDHSAQASSADRMGHGDKQMATPQQLNLLEDIR